MNLYLVGYRCTGKTSVGGLLSAALGWIFVDMDKELAVQANMAIQEIVASRGWQHFRELECRLLQSLSHESKQIVATGGGIVTTAANITLMQGSGKVVWLHASPAAIAERMAADSSTPSQRPPLHGEDAVSEIQEVFNERLPLYEQAMHYRVETDNLSLEEVAERVLRWLKTSQGR